MVFPLRQFTKLQLQFLLKVVVHTSMLYTDIYQKKWVYESYEYPKNPPKKN